MKATVRFLIEDLLDVAPIIYGKLTLNQQPVALEEVIDVALDAPRPVSATKRIASIKSGHAQSKCSGPS